MNKKAVGSILVAVSLVLALIQNLIWVSIGLLVVALVLGLEEKSIKRIAQCLALLLSVLVVKQLFILILGGFASDYGSSYYDFYQEFMKWVSIILNYYLIVFVILGLIFYLLDKDMPLYGLIIDKFYNGCEKLYKNGRQRNQTQNTLENNNNQLNEDE